MCSWSSPWCARTFSGCIGVKLPNAGLRSRRQSGDQQSARHGPGHRRVARVRVLRHPWLLSACRGTPSASCAGTPGASSGGTSVTTSLRHPIRRRCFLIIRRSLSHHYDGALGVQGAVHAHRPEQHPRKLAMASTPDDEKVRDLRRLLQDRSWVSLSDEGPHNQVWVNLSQFPEKVFEEAPSAVCWLIALREERSPIPIQSEGGPFPRRDHDEGGPGQLSLTGGPLQGSQRGGRCRQSPRRSRGWALRVCSCLLPVP